MNKRKLKPTRGLSDAVDRAPVNRHVPTQSIPDFNPVAPPPSWEQQHAGPHGYTRTAGSTSRVIWLPGAKPVPRLASCLYASDRVVEFGPATPRRDSTTFVFA